MKCPSCQVTKLVSSTCYFDRNKTTIGNFCPNCLQFQTFSEAFDKKRTELIIKQKLYAKPKFSRLKKVRMACPYCIQKDKPVVNRKKWKIEKISRKGDETQHWKCTCKICGNVWKQNNSNEYSLMNPNQKDYVLGF